MKKFLLTALIATFGILPACAEISVEESTSPQYLLNHGHSSTIVEMVQVTKANVAGEEYLTQDEIKHSDDWFPVRWVRKLFTYFDPALDNGSFMRHDSKPVPTVNDL